MIKNRYSFVFLYLHKVGFLAFCLVSFVGGTFAFAQVQQSSSTVAQTVIDSPPVQVPGSTSAGVLDGSPNAMTRSVVQRGVLSCAARVEQVTRFLGFGSQAAAHFMPPPAPADQRLFSLQMELPAGATGNSFVDMSFAPQQANGCGATYQAVSFWPQPCEMVGRQQFSSGVSGQILQRDVTVLSLGPQTKVFLMSAGTAGCISIKKEIVL